MFFDSYYFTLVIPAILLALFAQAKVQSAFAKYSQIRSLRGLTGREAAQRILLANGMSRSQPADHDPEFEAVLRTVMTHIARNLAKDGEGASKLIEVDVTGAETKEDARLAVKGILNSPLVKTAIFGADPNYGRLMKAIGKCGC